jgi:hypothetical protein
MVFVGRTAPGWVGTVTPPLAAAVWVMKAVMAVSPAGVGNGIRLLSVGTGALEADRSQAVRLSRIDRAISTMSSEGFFMKPSLKGSGRRVVLFLKGSLDHSSISP